MRRVLQSFIFMMLTLVSFKSATAQSAGPARGPSAMEGNWEGTMERGAARLGVRFDFRRALGQGSGRFSCPDWWVLEYPLRGFAESQSSMQFELGEDSPTHFDLRPEANAIVGSFRGPEGSGTITLHRTRPKKVPYTRHEVSIRDGSVTLAGTLLVPRTPGRHPAVVFLHGSGAQSRWGTIFYLADHLARRGIASLVFDQRGVGQSGGDWRTASYDDLARDAVAAVECLRRRADIDGHRIGLYGHSQGGTLTPWIAASSPQVGFIVAAGSVGGSIYEQDLHRVGNILRDHGLSADADARAMSFYRSWLDAARDGRGSAGLDSAVARARGEAWFSLVEPPAHGSWVWQWYPKVAQFNPLDYWRRVSIPVLVAYGENDRLEARDQYMRDIDGALREAGATDVTEIVLPRAEHNLTVHPEHELQAGESFEYYCPMDSAVVSAKPGVCPICNMYLEPRKPEGRDGGEWWRGAPGWPDLVAAWILARR